MQAEGSTEEEVCLHREKVPYNAFCFPKRLWSDLDLWSQVLRSKRDRLPNWPSILLRHSWNTGSLKEFWALLQKPKSHNCMSKCQSSQIQSLLTSWIWGSHWRETLNISSFNGTCSFWADSFCELSWPDFYYLIMICLEQSFPFTNLSKHSSMAQTWRSELSCFPVRGFTEEIVQHCETQDWQVWVDVQFWG